MREEISEKCSVTHVKYMIGNERPKETRASKRWHPVHGKRPPWKTSWQQAAAADVLKHLGPMDPKEAEYYRNLPSRNP